MSTSGAGQRRGVADAAFEFAVPSGAPSGRLQARLRMADQWYILQSYIPTSGRPYLRLGVFYPRQ
jgi:hypothetical protein